MAKKNSQTWYGKLTFNDVAMEKPGIPQEPVHFVFHDGTEGSRKKPYTPDTYGYDVLQYEVVYVQKKKCPDENAREWECMVQVGKHRVKCKFEMYRWPFIKRVDDNTFRMFTREFHFSYVVGDHGGHYHLKDRQGHCIIMSGNQCPDRPNGLSQALMQMLLLP